MKCLRFLQDELKVLLAGKPTIRQDIAKPDSIRHTDRYHPPYQLIFGDLTGSLNLVSLHITERVGLTHHFKGDGD
ncbi:MAG: hypothetical protein CG441_956 [Methylococcaceae bacterium NSM2-1]|jgi:hypothetical protein|nr:MAG: hypothetical protein CG441_956 [Methylococcaceae bacterium NSM2-1]